MTPDIPSWLLEVLPPFHPWARVDARHIRCLSCGVRARAERDPATGKPYTVWRWRNLLWDSRNSTSPTCPPNYSRQGGANPTVMRTT